MVNMARRPTAYYFRKLPYQTNSGKTILNIYIFGFHISLLIITIISQPKDFKTIVYLMNEITHCLSYFTVIKSYWESYSLAVFCNMIKIFLKSYYWSQPEGLLLGLTLKSRISLKFTTFSNILRNLRIVPNIGVLLNTYIKWLFESK